ILCLVGFDGLLADKGERLKGTGPGALPEKARRGEFRGKRPAGCSAVGVDALAELKESLHALAARFSLQPDQSPTSDQTTGADLAQKLSSKRGRLYLRPSSARYTAWPRDKAVPSAAVSSAEAPAASRAACRSRPSTCSEAVVFRAISSKVTCCAVPA